MHFISLSTVQRRLNGKIIFVALLVSLLALLSVGSLFAQDRGVPMGPTDAPFNATSDIAELRAIANANGTVRVIISLDASGVDTRSDATRTMSISGLQNTVLSGLDGLNFQVEHQFNFVPFMALTVDAAGLERLAASPVVTAIARDGLDRPFMDQSNIQIGVAGPGGAWEMGYEGTGQTVAILDTGVDKAHPALSGQVVSEACYGTTDGSIGSTTACPGGVESSTASGSGVDCDSSYEGCYHGTHVAGTVASTDSTYSGVAPEASLIAVQVFSLFDSFNFCAPFNKCVLSWTSDQVAGLERVYALRNTYDIASVNMSLGGGEYTGDCDSDPDVNIQSRKAIIDQLTDAGIAVVVASGNNGYPNAIGAPACIKNAISVGAVDGFDSVADFSNANPELDLLAPGVAITSTMPGGVFDDLQGTSMATPHVAGAWALMKEANPSFTVAEAETEFKATGVSVVDGGNGNTYPRIQVNDAIDGEPVPTGEELLVNISFEDYSDKQPNDWKVKGIVRKDKIVCNKILEDGSTKVKAYDGECAYQFKGVPGERVKVQQVVDPVTANLAVGDELVGSAYISGKKSGARLKMKVIVKYNDGTDKSKAVTTVTQTNDYLQFWDSVTVKSTDIFKIKYQLQHVGYPSKVRVDLASLQKISNGVVLPMPDAPEGTR